MIKWIFLALITAILLVIGSFFNVELHIHNSYFTIVVFFAIQTLVFFRIDRWAPEQWKSQVALVKIVVRLLSSLIFITVLIYTKEDLKIMVIQFILVYLIYMIFEIVSALTNLRRN